MTAVLLIKSRFRSGGRQFQPFPACLHQPHPSATWEFSLLHISAEPRVSQSNGEFSLTLSPLILCQVLPDSEQQKALWLVFNTYLAALGFSAACGISDLHSDSQSCHAGSSSLTKG